MLQSSSVDESDNNSCRIKNNRMKITKTSDKSNSTVDAKTSFGQKIAIAQMVCTKKLHYNNAGESFSGLRGHTT